MRSETRPLPGVALLSLFMEVWKIKEGLYQSSKIDDLEFFKSYKFDVVIDLEGGFDNIPKPDFIYLYFHFLDMPWLPDRKKLHAVALFGSSLWRGGAKILVHCAQGINRSSLVNGVILILRGFSGKEAVEIITTARPGALLNPIFRFYLYSLP